MLYVLMCAYLSKYIYYTYLLLLTIMYNILYTPSEGWPKIYDVVFMARANGLKIYNTRASSTTLYGLAYAAIAPWIMAAAQGTEGTQKGSAEVLSRETRCEQRRADGFRRLPDVYRCTRSARNWKKKKYIGTIRDLENEKKHIYTYKNNVPCDCWTRSAPHSSDF